MRASLGRSLYVFVDERRSSCNVAGMYEVPEFIEGSRQIMLDSTSPTTHVGSLMNLNPMQRRASRENIGLCGAAVPMKFRSEPA